MIIYNPHLTERTRIFVGMELGLQRMAFNALANNRVAPFDTSEDGVTFVHLACTRGAHFGAAFRFPPDTRSYLQDTSRSWSFSSSGASMRRRPVPSAA